uniref:Uncharacterized protein n=1 Tax=Arundo donax TaxID=35708 RepID=A0A0A9ES91_ARUDO
MSSVLSNAPAWMLSFECYFDFFFGPLISGQMRNSQSCLWA